MLHIIFSECVLQFSFFVLQVSELVSQYKREHLTVWGNANYEVVSKCLKEVRMGPAKLCSCLLVTVW